jgi:glycosyltransferase involved in cell wall biosynthesis
VLRHLPECLTDARVVVYCREGEERLAAGDRLELRRVAVRTAIERVVFETTVLSRTNADVLVSPNESLPLRLPCPTVVVAQNLAYHCARSAATYRGSSLSETARAAAQRWYYRRRMPAAYRRAAVIVAISNTAARVLAEQAALPLDRTVVALGGSDSVFVDVPAPTPRERERLLVVSAVAPYKNFDAVVDLLARLRAQRPGIRLEVAGGDWHGYTDVVTERARRAGVADAITFLGATDPERLCRLYAEATLLLHLSECEACPLPPLEAMRMGLPVVAAARSSIPEVVGDGAVLVEPDDRDGTARSVEELLGDAAARDELATRGKARAAELTWRRTAEGVAAAVRRAAR